MNLCPPAPPPPSSSIEDCLLYDSVNYSCIILSLLIEFPCFPSPSAFRPTYSSSSSSGSCSGSSISLLTCNCNLWPIYLSCNAQTQDPSAMSRRCWLRWLLSLCLSVAVCVVLRKLIKIWTDPAPSLVFFVFVSGVLVLRPLFYLPDLIINV